MPNEAISPREAIEALKLSNEVTVTAEKIAPCLRMNPGVLRKRVREGTYLISEVDYDPESGRIRFFRKDFLQKIGEIPPDSPQPTTEQLLTEILQGVKLICGYISLKVQDEKKTAGAATPTD